jgi:hypothetical protein
MPGVRCTARLSGQLFFTIHATPRLCYLASHAMKHDESALVKQALRDAREQLAEAGAVLPAAYMLVTKNPQTGAPLTHPTAIGAQCAEPFASVEAYREFLATLQAEAQRLGAIAVALAGEARAEIEAAEGTTLRRVLYLRVEDELGVHPLHATIDPADGGGWLLGPLLADPDAADDVDLRLLPVPD